MRVLVVDDHEATRVLHRRSLEQAGFEVEVARNGAEAVTWCATASIDAVICDLCLPSETDGRDAIKSILAAVPGVPVFAVSGFVSPRTDVEGLAAGLGVRRVFAKPLDVDLFVASIREPSGGSIDTEG